MANPSLPVAQFPKPESAGPREWGEEIISAVSPGNYMLKRIIMQRGSQGGLQYHRKRDEAGVMVRGLLKIYYDDGSGTLAERIVGPGSAFRFPPGAVHKALALTDCEYIEASTPFLNDRVHVEADYGIPVETGGLPTTELEDIVEA